MDAMGKRIRIARFNADLDQKRLAELIDVPKEYISYWESDKRTPTLEHIQALSKTLGVSLNYLFGMQESDNETVSNESVNLRLAGEVSCGNLTYATSEDGEYLTEKMPISFFSKYGSLSKREIEDNYFLLKANGDSMTPYIENGDTLICKRAPDVDSGKIGIVVSPDSEATAKIVSKSSDEVRLIPINKRYEDIVLTSNDDEFRVIAEVIYVLRKVRTFIM
jgi:repressor LexA